ncbi:unnamed protein product [Auanema sp. JU1783]|nr:unnamed protein product [Auanema sp. JU1783]
MKVKRVKRAAKILNFYKHHYKIAAPFKILVDGTFCMAALINKLNLREQLSKYLGGETHVVTTRCVMQELEQIGPDVYGALALCRHFDVVHCPHTPFKGANDCFIRLAKKAKTKGTKFIYATQDPELTEKIHSVPGAPVIYINGTSIILQKPSEVSVNEAKAEDPEIAKLTDLKRTVLGEVEKIKKVKKLRGVNPLSCKKKKMKANVPVTFAGVSSKTMNGKRRRKKLEKEERALLGDKYESARQMSKGVHNLMFDHS